MRCIRGGPQPEESRGTEAIAEPSFSFLDKVRLGMFKLSPGMTCFILGHHWVFRDVMYFGRVAWVNPWQCSRCGHLRSEMPAQYR